MRCSNCDLKSYCKEENPCLQTLGDGRTQRRRQFPSVPSQVPPDVELWRGKSARWWQCSVIQREQHERCLNVLNTEGSVTNRVHAGTVHRIGRPFEIVFELG